MVALLTRRSALSDNGPASPPGDWRTVVGVVATSSADQRGSSPYVYPPFAQLHTPSMTLHVRARRRRSPGGGRGRGGARLNLPILNSQMPPSSTRRHHAVRDGASASRVRCLRWCLRRCDLRAGLIHVKQSTRRSHPRRSAQRDIVKRSCAEARWDRRSARAGRRARVPGVAVDGACCSVSAPRMSGPSARRRRPRHHVRVATPPWRAAAIHSSPCATNSRLSFSAAI